MATEDTKVLESLTIPEDLGIVALSPDNVHTCCACGISLVNAFYQVPVFYYVDKKEVQSELFFCVRHMRINLPSLELKLRERLARQQNRQLTTIG